MIFRLIGQCGIGLTCGWILCASAQPVGRVANTTLQMPSLPPVYGYSTVKAFGSVGFTNPVAIVSAPGETNRLFVVEQRGVVSVITNLASPDRSVFLDISSQVISDQPAGERGLLGLAFHPGYATNGYFYLFYTSWNSNDNGLNDRLSRFQCSTNDPNLGDANSETILISQFDRADNHNAGDLQFGADGYLYVSLGDEGGSGGEYGNCQRIDLNFFSGILRIDVDLRFDSLPANPHPANTNNATGTVNYAIPPDNPFVGSTDFNGSPVDPNRVRTEFWAVGLRNPWRVSFDSANGRLYCGDVGQDKTEEIDVIAKGGNYGWNYYEGTRPFTGIPPLGFSPLDPILQYDHGPGTNQGSCVIGGVVYHGDRISQLTGAYVFGDYVSGNIWSLRYDGTNATSWSLLTVNPGVSAFGIDPRNGDVLLADQGAATLKRLVYNTNLVSGAPLPPTLADTGAFSDLSSFTPYTGIVPYSINVPFWSDHANKSRWFSIPDTNQFIDFNPTGNWTFPTGAVWIKHFELEMTNGVPESTKRIETRFIVRNTNGVYGVTYRWGDSTTNAVLVPEEGMDESFAIQDGGIVRTQIWHYPARNECLRCHTSAGGFALGFNTPQMNRDTDYGGITTNQILALSQAGYFRTNVSDVSTLTALVGATNAGYSLEYRTRSYLHANCAQCHQPGGGGLGNWDARITTPLTNAGIINGALINDLGDPNNRVVVPGSLDSSVLYLRVAGLGANHMPPIDTTVLNADAITLLGLWISNDASVADRHIFYNGSIFDGNDAGANGADDGAIATDKVALLGGQTGSFSNYTSYSRGINGIMVDITLLPGVPGAGDFTFRVGNDNNPGGWAPAPAPLSVTVRSGAGSGGSDRVTIIWADNAIQKQWLQVTVLATAATGLSSPDVFYFGNAVGESGNSTTDARVNATDEILARNNPRALGQAPVDFAYDYNRDGKVNATDEIIARNNPTSSLTALQLISVPGVAGGGGASSPLRLQSSVAAPVLRIRSIAVAGNDTLKVQFSGLNGGLYRLQSAAEVGQAVWQEVSPEPLLNQLSNNLYEFEVKKQAGVAAQFYRIVSQ